MYNIRLTATPGRRDDLLAVFHEMALAAVDEPGTLVYTFSTVDADPDMVITFELFADEAAVEAHKVGDAMQRLRPQLDGLVAHIDAKVGRYAFGPGVPAS